LIHRARVHGRRSWRHSTERAWAFNYTLVERSIVLGYLAKGLQWRIFLVVLKEGTSKWIIDS